MYTNPLAFSNHIIITTIIVPHPHLAIAKNKPTSRNSSRPCSIIHPPTCLPTYLPPAQRFPPPPLSARGPQPSLLLAALSARHTRRSCASYTALQLARGRQPARSAVAYRGWDGMGWDGDCARVRVGYQSRRVRFASRFYVSFLAGWSGWFCWFVRWVFGWCGWLVGMRVCCTARMRWMVRAGSFGCRARPGGCRGVGWLVSFVARCEGVWMPRDGCCSRCVC